MSVSVEGETQMSATWGGGVKLYPNERVGVVFTGRWTPTYIKSDPAGVWCSGYWSPWYPGGCVVLGDADFSNQFELRAGVGFRF